MLDDEIVVLHALDILHYMAVDVVGFLVVLQVFVVHESRSFEGLAEQQVSPVGKSPEYC